MKKLISLILFVAMFFFSIPIDRAYAAAPTDYVSCWNLDEASGTRVDSNTTNSNDLTDVNTVASAVGKISNGADFELSSSERLTITDATQVGLDISGDMALALWFKPESQPATSEQYAFTWKWEATQGQYGFGYANNAGTMQLRADMYDNNGPTTNIPYLKNTTLSSGTWYHIVFSFDVGTGTMTFYVNGSSLGTTVNATVNQINVGAGLFTMGAGTGGSSRYADGVFDIFEIYNRELTSTEVSDLYNSGNGVTCTGRGSSPVAEPAFNDPIYY